MDIRASTLYKKHNLEAVDLIISEHYKTISDKILTAHASGASQLIYELPEIFHAGNLEPAQVQIIVYSSLINKLENPPNSLFVRLIKRNNNSSALRIKWPSALDPSEMQKCKEIIKGHLEFE